MYAIRGFASKIESRDNTTLPKARGPQASKTKPFIITQYWLAIVFSLPTVNVHDLSSASQLVNIDPLLRC